MSLTATQQAEVRRFLGYSDQSAGQYSALEGALIDLSAEGETQVTTVLTDLAAIETQLRSSWGRQKVSKAEDVVLAGHDEIIALRQEGNRLCALLASVLGVDLQRQVFSSGPSTGLAGRG